MSIKKVKLFQQDYKETFEEFEKRINKWLSDIEQNYIIDIKMTETHAWMGNHEDSGTWITVLIIYKTAA